MAVEAVAASAVAAAILDSERMTCSCIFFPNASGTIRFTRPLEELVMSLLGNLGKEKGHTPQRAS